MTGKVLISVIIPNYNNAHFLGDAIQSVLNQTYQNFEIILVDDGSNDDSQQVVSSFGDRVRYIWQENKGLGGARNTGISAANGEFIGFLDADDQWLPDFLDTMVLLTKENPDAAVFFSNARYMDDHGRDLPQSVGVPSIPPEKIYHALLRANFIIPSTILAKRSVIVEEGLFDQTLKALHGCEDWDLWLRIAPRYKFIGTPACLVRYRLHGNTFSANPSRMQTAVRTVIEKKFGPDDGQIQKWTPDKRRAFGGVYRYYGLTTILRQDDWQTGADYLRHAIEIDPTLAQDLDLFYDLALGSQPLGHRGTSDHIDLGKNGANLYGLLNSIFSQSHSVELKSKRRLAFGTANMALGIIAYNTGQKSSCQRFLLQALYFRPELIRDNRVTGNLIKTLIAPRIIEKLKQIRHPVLQ